MAKSLQTFCGRTVGTSLIVTVRIRYSEAFCTRKVGTLLTVTMTSSHKYSV